MNNMCVPIIVCWSLKSTTREKESLEDLTQIETYIQNKNQNELNRSPALNVY